MVTKAAMKRPDPNSMRTLERSVALAWYRGCCGENECWPECRAAARDAILEGELDEDERPFATTSAYWKYTHLSGSSAHWERLLAKREEVS